MEHSKTFYKFNTVISLMSLNKDNENYEIVKNNISELLNKIDNIKDNDELINYGELIYKDLTKEELKNINYSELLLNTLIEIHYFNKEYEKLNEPSILNKMLEILEKRKNIMIYNLTHTINEQYKNEDLNDIYFNEYKPLYEKISCNNKYKYGNLYEYKKHCQNELIKQYKQNNKISYKDFDDIIKNA
jgi:hypothetical protein